MFTRQKLTRVSLCHARCRVHGAYASISTFKNSLIRLFILLVNVSHEDQGCISLIKSKIGLLREITRILFCEINKKSGKGLIADLSLRKKRKIQKRIFPSIKLVACFSVKTAYHMDFFRILSQRNTKVVNPKNPDSD